MTPAIRRHIVRASFVLAACLLAVALPGCGTSTPFVLTLAAPGALPAATIGIAYSAQIYASGVTSNPTGAVTYAITYPPNNGSEILPVGLTFHPSVLLSNGAYVATITGTPTDPGDNGKNLCFDVVATDSETPPHKSAAGQYCIAVN